MSFPTLTRFCRVAAKDIDLTYAGVVGRMGRKSSDPLVSYRLAVLYLGISAGIKYHE